MYEVIPTDHFKRDIKHYIEKKKYIHITDDVRKITDELEAGNLIGDEIPRLKVEASGHAFKVRSSNSDTKVGKSNGYRIIYYAIKDNLEIYLLTIYYKKDDSRVLSDKEIVELIAKY